MPVRYELRGVELPGRTRQIWRFGMPGCPIRLAKTPTGLGGAPLSHVRQSNARQPGATWRGTNREINPIGLQIRIGPMKPDDAYDVWGRWRESLGDGRNLCEFHVIDPKFNSSRFQWVRRELSIPDPDFAVVGDAGWLTEEVTLGSDESWWNGDPIAPPAYAPAGFSGRSLTNSSGVEAWVHWELTGPGVFAIGVDGEAVVLPNLAAGEVWTIETNPEYPHIRNAAGVDKWPLVGVYGQWYKPVKAYETAPLTMSGIGTNGNSRIKVTLPQQFERAMR